MQRAMRIILLLGALAIGIAGLLQVNHLLGQATANALPAVTTTPTPVFSATLSLAPSDTVLLVGEVLTMTADLSVSAGCQYPIFELSMSESDEESTHFDSIDPPTGIITGPIQLPSAWTFRAARAGTTTFRAQTFGERYCNDFWNWHYEYAESIPITVLEGEQRQFIPISIYD